LKFNTIAIFVLPFYKEFQSPFVYITF